MPTTKFVLVHDEDGCGIVDPDTKKTVFLLEKGDDLIGALEELIKKVTGRGVRTVELNERIQDTSSSNGAWPFVNYADVQAAVAAVGVTI